MILVGQADTVFLLRKGATLKNAIIGKNQGEGVYCIGGGCTIENVWFEDVCEDAISMYSPLPPTSQPVFDFRIPAKQC